MRVLAPEITLFALHVSRDVSGWDRGVYVEAEDAVEVEGGGELSESHFLKS